MIKVIIAEDDPQIAEIQRRFIERIEGFELIGIAHRLADAEDLIDIMQPDLLLLDIQFPSGTGFDLLRKIRAGSNAIDVIMITAAKEVDTLREALHGGVFDYILKPLVFERLQETLHNYQQHLQKLGMLETLAQSDVDRVLPRSSSTPESPADNMRLPKGIDAITLDNILNVFTQRDALNAEEVGDIIGASRTTARRYLEYLVSCSKLSAEVSYGTVGRPERRYQKCR
ncbi:response regulator [Amphritea sp. 1_MG-2023]|uniref:response regulator n=1 Tax=Amphritea sp. 1_MG-2023 TaxID=3062670 RepID=UPI0026E2D0BB|nr:response regulator [Amphritea sp. 1_MG-2023]MDO6561866.1 response regulator [Amphritea sp. 1_MG-2023]